VQLAAWLPGNTDYDRLQCAGTQISTLMHSVPFAQGLRSTNVTSVATDSLYTYLSHLISHVWESRLLTHCGRVTQFCVFNTLKLGTSASSP